MTAVGTVEEVLQIVHLTRAVCTNWGSTFTNSVEAFSVGEKIIKKFEKECLLFR